MKEDILEEVAWELQLTRQRRRGGSSRQRGQGSTCPSPLTHTAFVVEWLKFIRLFLKFRCQVVSQAVAEAKVLIWVPTSLLS